MTIKTINRETAKVLGNEIKDALQAILEKHGLELPKGIGGSFNDMEFHFKGCLKVADPAMAALREEQDFALQARFYNLDASHYKKRFSIQGKVYEVRGFNPSRPKWCIKAWNVTEGKMVAFADSVVPYIKNAK